MEKVIEFFDTALSTIIALLRLMFLAVCFVTSGIQVILFNRTEICNVEMKGCPLRCDKTKMDDKLSYVDRLMLENPGLLDLPEGPLTEEEMRQIEDFENDFNNDDEDDNHDKGI